MGSDTDDGEEGGPVNKRRYVKVDVDSREGVLTRALFSDPGAMSDPVSAQMPRERRRPPRGERALQVPQEVSDPAEAKTEDDDLE